MKLPMQSGNTTGDKPEAMSAAFETRIQQDVTQAMKARDEQTVATLRLVLTSMKNEQIAQRRPLIDDEIVQILQREVKRRREAAALYTQGANHERARAEEQEITILQRYLPEQLDEGAITKVVRESITKSGASSPADFGRVMGVVMGQLKGKADGAQVQAILKRELQQTPG